MGKETQLLEAATAGNNTKVEQILKGHSRLKRLLSKERLLEAIGENSSTDETDGSQATPMVIQTKLQSSHVDVDCIDENGSTPLIRAALNGHMDVVFTLLRYSANIQAVDNQGNTALHFAAWQNRSEIVELFLMNGAKSDWTNLAGNTPLHYACQYCPAGKTFTIVKLLQHNCGVLVQNKAGDTPFDLAVRFNRKGAVSLLVDAEPGTLKQTKSIIEAAKNGRKEIIEILLDTGMDPNCFDGGSGSCPLHEAVRFFRKDVTKILLEFGAQPDQRSANNESAVDIVMQHPEAKRAEFMRLFREYRGKSIRIPTAFLEQQTNVQEKKEMFITYPLLRNKPYWTKAEPEYCKAWTQKHPPTCLLDNDSTTYWRIPASGAYTWVTFDLGSEFTITGVRIAGWDNQAMVNNFMIETGKSLSGPWKQEAKYKAEPIGPEDINEAAESQDFKGFYATARYWRLVVADNYGDPSTYLAEVNFFGVENGIIEWFETMGFSQYLKDLVQRGFNQLSDLALLVERDIEDIVVIRDHRRKMLHGARILRERYYPPSNLQWAISPVNKTTADKLVPEFSVFSESFTVGDLELVVHGGAVVKGTTVVPLLAKDNGYLSKAAFRGITLSPPGRYSIEVRSAVDHSILLRAPEQINVVPPPMRKSELGRVFQDFEQMLQFDI